MYFKSYMRFLSKIQVLKMVIFFNSGTTGTIQRHNLADRVLFGVRRPFIYFTKGHKLYTFSNNLWINNAKFQDFSFKSLLIQVTLIRILIIKGTRVI